MRYPIAVRSVLLASLAGVLYFLGFVGFGIWPLAFVFMAVLLGAVRDLGPGRAWLLGVWMGFVAMCGGYYWVVHLLTSFAGLAPPLALLGNVLLNLYQGSLWGFVALVVVLGRRAGLDPAWGLPLAVLAVEAVYPLLFPSYVAASLFDVPWLAQIADLGGAPLVDGWIALINGGVYAGVRTLRLAPAAAREGGFRRSVGPALAAALSVVFVALYGLIRLSQVETEQPTLRTIRVALIQANLGAGDKTTRRAEFLTRHQEMSRQVVADHPDVQLIVWPESAFNRAVRKSRPVETERLVVGIGRSVLSGVITVDRVEGERYVYNSAVLTGSDGSVRGFYDKVRLLAFGETIPFVNRFPWLKSWFPRTGGFDYGTTLEHLKLEDGTPLLPLICYEDLLPGLIRELWQADGPPGALVNVTNDSWYGDTHEPRIHLALAALRSIETRRSLIRSTNTGISAFVDPAGQIIKRTGQWTREVLIADVPVVDDGRSTFFVRFGNWAGWGALAVWLVGGLWSWRRRT